MVWVTADICSRRAYGAYMAMNILILFLAFFLIGSVASANNPTTDFDIHLKALGIPIDGVSGSGASVRIDCAQCTSAQLQQAQQEAQTFDWSFHVDPNPQQAEISILMMRIYLLAQKLS